MLVRGFGKLPAEWFSSSSAVFIKEDGKKLKPAIRHFFPGHSSLCLRQELGVFVGM